MDVVKSTISGSNQQRAPIAQLQWLIAPDRAADLEAELDHLPAHH